MRGTASDAVNELRAALLGGDTLTPPQVSFLVAILGSLDHAVRRYETATTDHPQLTGADLDHYRAAVMRSLAGVYRAERDDLMSCAESADSCRS